MNRRDFLLMGSCAAAAGCLSARPKPFGATEDEVTEFWKAVRFLEETKATDYDRRQEALAVAQKMIYSMKPADDVYDRMMHAPDDQAIAALEAEFPVLAWYDRAFDRVLKEVAATTVTADSPAVWYVYNMGIIVKSVHATFSIDLCHRQAVRMAPLLDFALVSHNHGDHYTSEFLGAMLTAKKPVITNFMLNRGWYCPDAPREFETKGIKIRSTSGDHNDLLPNAVITYEVTIPRGPGKEPFVLCHSGDTCHEEQFQPLAKHPDLFIGHCAVGLRFPNAWKTTMPAKTMVIAHHQELGHLWSRWRCVGFHEEPAKIMKELRALGANVIMPVWGDRIV